MYNYVYECDTYIVALSQPQCENFSQAVTARVGVV